MPRTEVPWPSYPVINDPARPDWHFAPPAQWMNDPNGPAWHDGWLHLFYQHNPGGDAWGDMHWGHARSRDSVHWEHLPLALRPQRAAGEQHCFSGCLALTAAGEPRIIYTSVPADSARPATQVLASPHDLSWRAWTQHVATPALDLATHGGPAFDRDWRDPFVFRTEGRTFLILGATLGDEAVIPLYENPDGGLQHWVYRGIIHRAPRTTTPFFECPNLVQLGTKWLLLTSPAREVEWCSGTLDLSAPAFHVEQRGRADEGDGFYATQLVRTPSGRDVLFGWAKGFLKDRGWHGCLAAPRGIWLDQDGWLCSAPVSELASLRASEASYLAQTLGPTPVALALLGDHRHEVELTFERAPAACVQLEVGGVRVIIGPDGVWFNDRPPVPLESATTTRVHWLFDRTLLEIFVGDRAAFTHVVPFPAATVMQLSASGGYARLVNGRGWALRASPSVRGF